MKYIKEFNSFSLDQVKKGLQKSIDKKDIELKTSIDNIIGNINDFNFEVGSVEAFLYDDENFISDALPNKLVNYIKDNNLDIDTSKLVKYIELNKEYYKIDDKISDLNYLTMTDTDDELIDLYNRQDEISNSLKLLEPEILIIKNKILKNRS